MGLTSWNAAGVIEAVSKQAEDGMRKAADGLVRQVQAGLSGSSPSAEGSPPGEVTGELIRAVSSKVAGGSDGPAVLVGVVDDPEQAAKGARLAGGFVGRDALGRFYNEKPRPWLAPVVLRNKDAIVRDIAGG